MNKAARACLLVLAFIYSAGCADAFSTTARVNRTVCADVAGLKNQWGTCKTYVRAPMRSSYHGKTHETYILMIYHTPPPLVTCVLKMNTAAIDRSHSLCQTLSHVVSEMTCLLRPASTL